ncbi:hypothetical protein SAMN05421780_1044 [Flexibacter flexilis DSM 6793]|uniref:Uncharacterized protein n=1 Tax=Flexibacter flexilis DSM 6793 TaxID=927664 RepID=A0A1I1HKA2_9BACT|nr:hypothetical protein SAMN05421780_1044 [Flexibacter flexilis DSM 6793]
MNVFFRAIALFLCSSLLFSMSSCLVSSTHTTVVKKDSGKHKGWYKNSNNPHHPHSTNPGHGNKKVKVKMK